MSNDHLPIKPTDKVIVDAVVLPDSIDENRIGFPVNVIDRLDKRVMGTADWFNGRVHQFRRGTGRFRVRPRYDLEVEAGSLITDLRINLSDLYKPILVADLDILANGIPVIDDDSVAVTWTVTIVDNGQVIHDRTFEGRSNNQQLLNIGEWYGTITITAVVDDLSVTLTEVKERILVLADVVVDQTLSGFQLPAWAI